MTSQTSYFEDARSEAPAPEVAPKVAPEPKRARRRSPRKSPWLRRLPWLVAGLLVAGLVAVAAAPKPIPVELGTVASGPLEVTVAEDGRTRVKTRHVLTAPLAGQLLRPDVRAGDAVEAGQIVARILPQEPPLLDARSRAEAEARVSAAKARLEQARASEVRARSARAFAERESARQRDLAERQIVARDVAERAALEAESRAAEHRAAEEGVRLASSELEAARATSRQASGAPQAAAEAFEVRAPASGRVLRLERESAGVVMAGAPLLEVGDLEDLEVVVDVLTADAVRIPNGAQVRLHRWGGAAPLEGRVRRVEPSAFTRVSALGVEEQRVRVLVDPSGDPGSWSALGDGFRVETEIVVWSADRVTKVPQSALFRRGGQWATFVVRDGRAALEPVDIGQRSGHEAQVLGGLPPGTTVIVYPSDRVVDGARVAEQGG